MKYLKEYAYAKINIGLEVLWKRDDGYHNINTVMSLIDLADELELIESPRTEVLCPQVPELNMQNNIIYKTLVELKKKYYLVDMNAKITLHKKIPIGAGLGGGSSDAAKSLQALNELWHIGLTKKKMNELAIKIGSDVPFFLKSQSAIVKGKGEIIEYFKYRIPYIVLVVFPKIHISTKEAYESLNIGDNIKQPTDYLDILKYSIKSPYLLKENIKNDFEDVIFPKYPILKEIKEELYGFGSIFALMSGSGSSVYGFFEREFEAEIAAAHFKEFECYLCNGI